jgi:hypothetical protein
MTKIKNLEKLEVEKLEVLENESKNTIVKQKRGRKSKKELQYIMEQKEKEKEKEHCLPGYENIVCVIDENNDNNDVKLHIINNCSSIDENVVVNEYVEIKNKIIEDNNDSNDNNDSIDNNDSNDNNDSIDNNDSNDKNDKIIVKKRGRKPKGGKIIQQLIPLNNNKEVKPNVILHLKCSLKDLQTNTINSCVESFNFPFCKNELNYELINSNINSSSSLINNNYNTETSNTKNINVCYEDEYYDNGDCDEINNKDVEIKDIWKKLKILEHNLHINNISDKKSACFWCTCEFDNPPVYIPKYYIKESYHVYGCFCSPECATAYLMEENIDSSSKFERYHLINHIYSKIYDYNKNIKPAPNPFYVLDKYYGNLSIQEYRSLLRNERLFLIVDKPLTRILPELHEDNDEFIINNKIIPSNTYQIKKKLQKKTQSKNNILNEKFGLNS